MDMQAKTEDSIGKRLLKLLISELKHGAPNFHAMNEYDQGRVIDRMRLEVEGAVRVATADLMSGKYDRVAAKVESCTLKDGVKIVLKGHATPDQLSKLAPYVGHNGMLVMCDIEQFIADMNRVKPEPDQADAFEGEDIQAAAEAEQAGEPEDSDDDDDQDDDDDADDDEDDEDPHAEERRIAQRIEDERAA